MNKLMIFKKNVFLSFLAIFCYKIILDLSYYFIISPVWGYRFSFNVNYLKLAESFFLLFIIFILMPKTKEKLSSIMVWILILLTYIPMLTLFALNNESRIFMYAVAGFWLLVFLLLKIPSFSARSIKKSQSKIITYSIFFILFSIVFLMVYRYFGFSFSFNLRKVYEVRSAYVAMDIPLSGYLFTWVAKVINPIFFALFLVKKKWFPFSLIIVLQLLLFTGTGHKSYLFILPFVLGFMWIVTRRNPLFYMCLGLIGIILLGMFSFWLIDDLWVSSLFARRTLLVPANLSFLYYDFFSQNEYTFLSQHRIFEIFLEYPYHLPPPNLIAETYYGRPETHANNGLYSDAYMNLGFIGLFLWAIFLTIILKLIDSFSKNKDMRVTIAATARPMMSIRSGALLTNIFTHGLLLTLIILYLLPKDMPEKLKNE